MWIKYCHLLLFTFPQLVFSQITVDTVAQMVDSAQHALKINDLVAASDWISHVQRVYEEDSRPVDTLLLRSKLLEGDVLVKRGLLEPAYQKIDEAEEHWHALPIEYTALLALIQQKRAKIECLRGDYEGCLSSANLAYRYHQEADTVPTLRSLSILMTIAAAHYRLYQTQEAIDIYTQILGFQNQVLSPGHPGIARVLNNLANAYHDQRQYDKAILHLHRALAIQIEHWGAESPELANVYYNLALNLESKGAYADAITNYQRSAQLTRSVSPDHPFLADDYRKIGDCLIALNDLEAAEMSYERALTTYARIRSDVFGAKEELFRACARLQERKGNNTGAMAFLEKAYEYASTHLGASHPRVATILENQAALLLKMGDLSKATELSDRALNILNYRTDKFLPDSVDAKGILLHVLSTVGLVRLQQFKNQHDTAFLVEALQFFQDAIQTLEYIRLHLQEEDSKILLGHQNIQIYEGAMEAAFLLYRETREQQYVETAFSLSEQSRRSTVLESILSRNPAAFPGVSSITIAKERSLIAAISRLEGQYFDFNQSPEKVNEHQKKIFDLKRQLYELLDSIKIKSPAYYNYRFAAETPEVIEMSQYLEDHQGVIELFESESGIYVFYLTGNSVEISRIELDVALKRTIDEFIVHLSNRDSVLSQVDHSLRKLNAASHRLYEIFLSHLSIDKEITDLLIIPDGIATQLIFDLFLTAPGSGNPRNWPFLFKDFRVFYAQSLLAWIGQIQMQSISEKECAIFTPSYDDLDDLASDVVADDIYASIVRSEEITLPGAVDESRTINALIPGTIFSSNQATERVFVNQMSKYRVVHLSAHAIVNHEMPALSRFIFTNSEDTLYDDRLTAAEICNLDLSAELAVLSACHTGSGKVNRGEGIMSLGRAFSLAGVPAIIQSQWKVPDRSTARLMPFLYAALKKGKQKHDALNFARLKYLETTEVSTECHPYFWGGFVVYGDTSPIKFSYPVSFAGILLGIFAVCLVFLIWKRITH